MDFDFGCAKPLYQQGVHPRVLLGPEDVEKLRRRIRSGDGLKIMQALRRKVRLLVESVLKSRDLAQMLLDSKKSHHEPGALVLYGLREMAMVALLDEDTDAIEATRQVQLASCLPELRAKGFLPLPIAYDLLFNHLPEEDSRTCRKALVEDIPSRIANAGPAYYRRAGHNITLGTALTALWSLLAIRGDPGVPDLDGEQSRLLSMFEATLHVIFNPDGYPEEDIGYGTAVGAYMSQLGEALRRAGIYDPYAECPRYARFGQAVLHFVQPWGENLSNTGDHGDDFGEREFVLARLAHETGDWTLTWLLGTLYYTHGMVHPENLCPEFYIEVPLRRGFRTHASAMSLIVLDDLKKAVHPARAKLPTQFRDRSRGIVSFRSGWNRDDTLLVFDGSQRSPAAQGHWHASAGHFSLSAVGEYFAIDTGRYNIEQNCHNVVLVDGKSGRSTDGEWDYVKYHGLLTDYLPGEFVDFAAADSSQHSDCYWARRCVGLAKGAGAPAYAWTVDDVNKANDYHEFRWQLHTSPENSIETRTDSATIRGWRQGNLLDVHWALPPADEYPKPHILCVTQDVATPSSYKYIPHPFKSVKGYRRPSDMVHGPVYVRPRLLAKVAGLNGRFMSVMIPRHTGERPAEVVRLESLPNSLALRIRFPQVEDTLIFAYEHNLLEAGEVKGRGQWCVVRRSRKTGRALAWELGRGTSLSVSGKGLESARRSAHGPLS